MNFPGFLGNEPIKAALSAAFAAGRFPHALLLQGEAGCGKRTLAGLIARALVCRDRDRAPCGVCPSCVRALAGSHPDIRVVEGTGATRSLSVETVRAVTADAYRMPEEAELSVFILNMGSRTTEAAQNKLLKVIEEPPEGAVFLLVAESAEQLLPTIRSRVQCFTLKPPPVPEAAAWLTEHGELSPEEAEDLAALCGGNLGRALAERQGGEAAKAREAACAVVSGMLASGEDPLLKAVAPLQKDRRLCAAVLDDLALIFRDAVVLRAGADCALMGAARQEAERLSGLPRGRLIRLPEIAGEYRALLDRNVNLPLLLTALCARLREAVGR